MATACRLHRNWPLRGEESASIFFFRGRCARRSTRAHMSARKLVTRVRRAREPGRLRRWPASLRGGRKASLPLRPCSKSEVLTPCAARRAASHRTSCTTNSRVTQCVALRIVKLTLQHVMPSHVGGRAHARRAPLRPGSGLGRREGRAKNERRMFARNMQRPRWPRRPGPTKGRLALSYLKNHPRQRCPADFGAVDQDWSAFAGRRHVPLVKVGTHPHRSMVGLSRILANVAQVGYTWSATPCRRAELGHTPMSLGQL